MTAPRNPRSKAKASIIFDLMVSPRLKSDIISKYSKQSSKGIYRHLIDLESEKVIREVREKGARPILVLNKRDFTSTGKALSYLIDAHKKIGISFDKAFVECAISAYGDFPFYGPYLDDVNMDFPYRTLNALGKAQRPEIDETLMTMVSGAIEKTRGRMTTEDKLAYIALVDRLSNSDWSPDERSPLSRSMTFLFSTAEQEKKNGNINDPLAIEEIWDFVITKIIHMATGNRKNFLDDIRDSRELRLMLARIQLYEASLVRLSEIDLANMLSKEFLTPEMRSQIDRDKITEISQLPEIYRKEAEQEQAKNAEYQSDIIQFKTVEELISGLYPPRKKKKFRLFRSP